MRCLAQATLAGTSTNCCSSPEVLSFDATRAILYILSHAVKNDDRKNAHALFLSVIEGGIKRLPCVSQPPQCSAALGENRSVILHDLYEINVGLGVVQPLRDILYPLAAHFRPRANGLLDGRPVFRLLR